MNKTKFLINNVCLDLIKTCKILLWPDQLVIRVFSQADDLSKASWWTVKFRYPI
jgi:hypothetical protein